MEVRKGITGVVDCHKKEIASNLPYCLLVLVAATKSFLTSLAQQ